ncbi:hypothetical protein Tco_1467724 [Tanacetum coccineum]
MTHNSLQPIIVVIATVLPFFFVEASPATAFPGSSGGTFVKNWGVLWMVLVEWLYGSFLFVDLVIAVESLQAVETLAVVEIH